MQFCRSENVFSSSRSASQGRDCCRKPQGHQCHCRSTAVLRVHRYRNMGSMCGSNLVLLHSPVVARIKTYRAIGVVMPQCCRSQQSLTGHNPSHRLRWSNPDPPHRKPHPRAACRPRSPPVTVHFFCPRRVRGCQNGSEMDCRAWVYPR